MQIWQKLGTEKERDRKAVGDNGLGVMDEGHKTFPRVEIGSATYFGIMKCTLKLEK